MGPAPPCTSTTSGPSPVRTTVTGRSPLTPATVGAGPRILSATSSRGSSTGDRLPAAHATGAQSGTRPSPHRILLRPWTMRAPTTSRPCPANAWAPGSCSSTTATASCWWNPPTRTTGNSPAASSKPTNPPAPPPPAKSPKNSPSPSPPAACWSWTGSHPAPTPPTASCSSSTAASYPPDRIAAIRLQSEELRNWAWCDPTDCAHRLPAVLARRVAAALEARTTGVTSYLENGHPVEP